MSVVLDASALIAVLLGEPGAVETAEAALGDCAVTAVNFAEARDHLIRNARDPQRSAAAVDGFVDETMAVLVCGRDLALRASELRSDRYRRRGRPVSLADCFAIAAAEARGSALVTSDRDQTAVARAVGVEVVGVPNSRGVRPG